MLERKKQDLGSNSAIVVTSSFAANIPMAGFATYSASKRLSSSLAEILYFEMAKYNRIDVLSWQCGEVHTKMNKEKPSFKVATVKQAVDGVLSDIGLESMTFGCIKHDFIQVVMQKLAFKSIICPAVYRFLSSKYRKQ